MKQSFQSNSRSRKSNNNSKSNDLGEHGLPRRVTRRSLKMAKQKQIDSIEEMKALDEVSEVETVKNQKSSGKKRSAARSIIVSPTVASSDSDEDRRQDESDKEEEEEDECVDVEDVEDEVEAENEEAEKNELDENDDDEDKSASEKETSENAYQCSSDAESEIAAAGNQSKSESEEEYDSDAKSARPSFTKQRNVNTNRRGQRAVITTLRRNVSHSTRKVTLTHDRHISAAELVTPSVARSRVRIQRSGSASALRQNSVSRVKSSHVATPIKHRINSATKSKIPELNSGQKSGTKTAAWLVESGQKKENELKQMMKTIERKNGRAVTSTALSREQLREMMLTEERARNEDLIRTKQQIKPINGQRVKTVRSATAVKAADSTRRRRVVHHEA